MDLRILLFFVTVPWIICETAKTNKVVPRHKGILKVDADEELNSGSKAVMEVKKPKVQHFDNVFKEMCKHFDYRILFSMLISLDS